MDKKTAWSILLDARFIATDTKDYRTKILANRIIKAIIANYGDYKNDLQEGEEE